MNNPSAFPGIEGINGYGNSTPMVGPNGEILWVNNSPGMPLRDWFAGHAPDFPSWFEPQGLTPLPLRPDDADYCDGCQAGADCEKTERCLKMQDFKARLEIARNINKLETLVKWRFFYADAMLAEREKGKQ